LEAEVGTAVPENKKEILNYTFKEVQEGSAETVLENDASQVTYVYEGNPTTVTYRYLSDTGKELTEDEVDSDYRVGQAIAEPEAKTFDHYSFVRREGDTAAGANGSSVITYIYEGNASTVTYRYLNQHGDEIYPQVTDTQRFDD
ncbi:MucBP domain-containing protein, partial [Enterococcus pallens]